MSLGIRKSNSSENHDLGLSITHNYTDQKYRNGKDTNISIYTGDVENCKDDEIATGGNGVKYEMFKYKGGTLGGFVRSSNFQYKNKQYGGGVRGNVNWLSKQSRRNLLKNLYRIDRSQIDPDEVKFITLTYDGNNDKNSKITGRQYKNQLRVFTQYLLRNYGGCGLWKFELGIKRYERFRKWVGHFHLIWLGVDFFNIKDLCIKWNDITGGCLDHRKIGVDVETSRSWKGVSVYGSKLIGYVGKNQEKYIDLSKQFLKEIQIGRLWGTVNKKMFKEYIKLDIRPIPEWVYTKCIRVVKKLYQSWLRSKGDFIGLKKMKKYQKFWNSRQNLKLEFFIENREIDKLISWASRCTQLLDQQNEFIDLETGEIILLN